MARAGSYKVQIRKGFSDRNAGRSANNKMQLEQLDEHARMSLFNTFVSLYNDAFHTIASAAVSAGGMVSDFWTRVLNEAYGKPASYSKSRSFDEDKMLKIVGNTLLQDEYDDVLSFIEYLAGLFKEKDRYLGTLRPCETFNAVFEREYMGYRFVNGHIVPITDGTEIHEIEEAVDSPIERADEHLRKAIRLLSDREAPDYGASMEESLRAVQAICSEMGVRTASPGEALKKLEERIDRTDVPFEEARFLLVASSAYINYLKVLQSRGDEV